MNKTLSDKLSKLPRTPGVYFHKDKKGEIIYIGKAAVLNNRVRQYFHKSRTRDPKTDALVNEIADIDWIEVETEIDALFLEAELIRRNLPRYNILLRDDKSLVYIRISYKSDHPTLSLTRRPLDDKAEYFGPYLSAQSVKKALKYLRRIFPYSTHVGVVPKRVCLQYHLGLCPGLEENKTSLKDYRANLRKLMHYLRGERSQLMADIEKDMKKAAKTKDFELAAKYRNQLNALRSLFNRVVFSDKESQNLAKDEGLNSLAQLLSLKNPPKRIEGYDISHMQGTNNTASMVVFVNGMPNKVAYRKFKMRLPGNNDFGHMEEVISRRLSEKNQKGWSLPNLFLIDGGKGQLSSAIKSRDQAGIDIPMIGLAKREEEIVVDMKLSKVKLNPAELNRLNAYVRYSGDFAVVSISHSAPVVKLLQRVRDESHRFAVSYHTVLKVKSQKNSKLDEIPGIGPITKKTLLKKYGSITALSRADTSELSSLVGSKKANLIKQHIGVAQDV